MTALIVALAALALASTARLAQEHRADAVAWAERAAIAEALGCLERAA